jgi:hypothetical protein
MEIERLPLGQSLADKHRAAELKWRGKPPGIPPEMAVEFMFKLQAGSTIRKLTGGGKLGPPFVSYERFKKHCLLHPDWAAEVRKLSEANVIVLKGSPRRSRTHCSRGHEFAVHGLGYKNHVNGRQYRYCKLCNKMNARHGCELPSEMVDKIKALVRAGSPIGSFTSGGKPGYLCRFASVKRLRHDDPEFNNLVLLGAQRRKLIVQTTTVVMPKPQIIKATNIRATLSGNIAGRADVVFTAVSDAVSHRLPRHIRDEVLGQLYLDVEEGRVAFSDIKRYARKYTSDLYEEEKHRISLDEPAFRGDTGGSRLDRLSEADGIWA